MDLQLSTPALLFSTISLLLLAFTNRFFGLSNVIRTLYAEHQKSPDPVYLKQISNLRRRVRLLRDMQFLGVLSLLLCVVCMGMLYFGLDGVAQVTFAISLLLMAGSLTLSLIEIWISTHAIDLHLKGMEQDR